MKKILTFLAASAITISSYSQIVINEIDPATDKVELKNVGTESKDISTYQLCIKPGFYASVSTLLGESSIDAGEVVVLQTSWDFIVGDGQLALYATASYGSSTAIVDFLQWGSNHTNGRQSVAVAANIWTNGEFISGVGTGESIEYDGEGDAVADFDVVSTTSLGSENASITGLFNSVNYKVEVYPNPVVNTLYLGKTMKSVTVLNNNGVVVSTYNNVSELDFTSMINGIYTLELLDANNQLYSAKILK